LQTLIDSGDMAKIMAYLSKDKYSKTNDEWESLIKWMKSFLKNKTAELMWWEQSLNALNKLMQMVEVKLRKESWAAINSSERLSNFSLFLPQPWESNALQREKMKSWDALILRNLRSAWLPSVNQYVPIFWSQARQIRAN
jgi:hypothetical protein